jgi:hypothetical protein
MVPEELARRAAAVLGDQLLCVVLYGSAAAGDFVPGVSNFNLLLVTKSLDVAQLDQLGPLLADWSGARHPPPLLFTEEQLRSACDAFPIELLDLRQSRRILWGSDLLSGLQICTGDLRLQIERELLGKLLALRSQYAVVHSQADDVQRLMLRTHSTFLVLFRAALRLFQAHVPEQKLDALRQLALHIRFDTIPFERLAAQKQRLAEAGPALSAVEQTLPATPGVAFADYLKSIEEVVHAINVHRPPGKLKEEG